MLYRIADVNIEIEPIYEYSRSILEPYRVSEGKPDLKIFATRERLEAAMSKNPALIPDEAEQICLADSFCRAILRLGGVFLHSSAIEFEGKAYLFSAASQVGKSTHTSLWIKKFGADKVKIINDDRPIIKMKNGVVTVYGGPFSGGSGKERNTSVPLGAVFFLKRGEVNRVRKIYGVEIISNFIDNTIKRESEEYLSALLDRIGAFMETSDFYELVCTPDLTAVDCVYNVIKGIDSPNEL